MVGDPPPVAVDLRRRDDAGEDAPHLLFVYENLSVWDHFGYLAAARGLEDAVWKARAEAMVDQYQFALWAHQPVLRALCYALGGFAVAAVLYWRKVRVVR